MDTTTISDQCMHGFLGCGWDSCKHGDMLVVLMG